MWVYHSQGKIVFCTLREIVTKMYKDFSKLIMSFKGHPLTVISNIFSEIIFFFTLFNSIKMLGLCMWFILVIIFRYTHISTLYEKRKNSLKEDYITCLFCEITLNIYILHSNIRVDQNAWCLQIFAPQVFFERYICEMITVWISDHFFKISLFLSEVKFFM